MTNSDVLTVIMALIALIAMFLCRQQQLEIADLKRDRSSLLGQLNDAGVIPLLKGAGL